MIQVKENSSVNTVSNNSAKKKKFFKKFFSWSSKEGGKGSSSSMKDIKGSTNENSIHNTTNTAVSVASMMSDHYDHNNNFQTTPQTRSLNSLMILTPTQLLKQQHDQGMLVTSSSSSSRFSNGQTTRNDHHVNNMKFSNYDVKEELDTLDTSNPDMTDATEEGNNNGFYRNKCSQNCHYYTGSHHVAAADLGIDVDRVSSSDLDSGSVGESEPGSDDFERGNNFPPVSVNNNSSGWKHSSVTETPIKKTNTTSTLTTTTKNKSSYIKDNSDINKINRYNDRYPMLAPEDTTISDDHHLLHNDHQTSHPPVVQSITFDENTFSGGYTYFDDDCNGMARSRNAKIYSRQQKMLAEEEERSGGNCQGSNVVVYERKGGGANSNVQKGPTNHTKSHHGGQYTYNNNTAANFNNNYNNYTSTTNFSTHNGVSVNGGNGSGNVVNHRPRERTTNTTSRVASNAISMALKMNTLFDFCAFEDSGDSYDDMRGSDSSGNRNNRGVVVHQIIDAPVSSVNENPGEVDPDPLMLTNQTLDLDNMSIANSSLDESVPNDPSATSNSGGKTLYNEGSHYRSADNMVIDPGRFVNNEDFAIAEDHVGIKRNKSRSNVHNYNVNTIANIHIDNISSRSYRSSNPASKGSAAENSVADSVNSSDDAHSSAHTVHSVNLSSIFDDSEDGEERLDDIDIDQIVAGGIKGSIATGVVIYSGNSSNRPRPGFSSNLESVDNRHIGGTHQTLFRSPNVDRRKVLESFNSMGGGEDFGSRADSNNFPTSEQQTAHQTTKNFPPLMFGHRKTSYDNYTRSYLRNPNATPRIDEREIFDENNQNESPQDQHNRKMKEYRDQEFGNIVVGTNHVPRYQQQQQHQHYPNSTTTASNTVVVAPHWQQNHYQSPIPDKSQTDHLHKNTSRRHKDILVRPSKFRYGTRNGRGLRNDMALPANPVSNDSGDHVALQLDPDNDDAYNYRSNVVSRATAANTNPNNPNITAVKAADSNAYASANGSLNKKNSNSRQNNFQVETVIDLTSKKLWIMSPNDNGSSETGTLLPKFSVPYCSGDNNPNTFQTVFQTCHCDMDDSMCRQAGDNYYDNSHNSINISEHQQNYIVCAGGICNTQRENTSEYFDRIQSELDPSGSLELGSSVLRIGNKVQPEMIQKVIPKKNHLREFLDGYGKTSHTEDVNASAAGKDTTSKTRMLITKSSSRPGLTLPLPTLNLKLPNQVEAEHKTTPRGDDVNTKKPTNATMNSPPQYPASTTPVLLTHRTMYSDQDNLTPKIIPRDTMQRQQQGQYHNSQHQPPPIQFFSNLNTTTTPILNTTDPQYQQQQQQRGYNGGQYGGQYDQQQQYNQQQQQQQQYGQPYPYYHGSSPFTVSTPRNDLRDQDEVQKRSRQSTPRGGGTPRGTTGGNINYPPGSPPSPRGCTGGLMTNSTLNNPQNQQQDTNTISSTPKISNKSWSLAKCLQGDIFCCGDPGNQGGQFGSSSSSSNDAQQSQAYNSYSFFRFTQLCPETDEVCENPPRYAGNDQGVYYGNGYSNNQNAPNSIYIGPILTSPRGGNVVSDYAGPNSWENLHQQVQYAQPENVNENKKKKLNGPDADYCLIGSEGTFDPDKWVDMDSPNENSSLKPNQNRNINSNTSASITSVGPTDFNSTTPVLVGMDTAFKSLAETPRGENLQNGANRNANITPLSAGGHMQNNTNITPMNVTPRSAGASPFPTLLQGSSSLGNNNTNNQQAQPQTHQQANTLLQSAKQEQSALEAQLQREDGFSTTPAISGGWGQNNPVLNDELFQATPQLKPVVPGAPPSPPSIEQVNTVSNLLELNESNAFQLLEAHEMAVRDSMLEGFRILQQGGIGPVRGISTSSSNESPPSSGPSVPQYTEVQYGGIQGQNHAFVPRGNV